jgi:hypothetical protein
MSFSCFSAPQAARLAAAAVAATLVTLPASAQSPADASVSDQGYSFVIGVGRIDHRYKELPDSQPVRSQVRTQTPILATGAVYAVSPQLMFSLGSEVTVFPDTATETWTATSSSFGGKTLTNRVLQTNRSSFSHSDTQLIGHYRLAGDGFLLGGPSVRTQSFKRHSFQPGVDQAVSLPTVATVEESSTEVLLHLGAGLESGGVKGRQNHYSLKALVGMPVVRRVENTNYPAARFNGTRGFDLSLEGRYSWAVHAGVHVGVWGRWSASRRGAQSQTVTSSGSTVSLELPRHEQSLLGYGVELLWKL